jgi:hypothetical protein
VTEAREIAAEQVSRLSAGSSAGIQVRSALNPLLKLAAFASPLCFLGAYMFSASPVIVGVLVVSGLVPIYGCVLWYGYFAWKSPERLQSEDYQLRHETMQLIRVTTEARHLDPDVLRQLISMPLRQLPPTEDDEEAPRA